MHEIDMYSIYFYQIKVHVCVWEASFVGIDFCLLTEYSLCLSLNARIWESESIVSLTHPSYWKIYHPCKQSYNL